MSEEVEEPLARSFERINYSVRPAKAAERHMMVEAIGRLTRFSPLGDYTYVGFGSTFFIDFKLLHQRYAMTRLWSIEIDDENKQRFLFNKPYDCIEMLFGAASKRLADVEWQGRAIVWLDYDYSLRDGVLSDIARVIERVPSGSMIIVTVDADPREHHEGRAERMRDELEGYKPNLKDEQLGGWAIAEHYFEVLGEAIAESVEAAHGDSLEFEQIFAFRYRDGNRMATYGGIVVSPEERSLFEECRFDELPYVVRRAKPSFEVAVPNLTPREQAEIDNFMPTDLAAARSALEKRRVPKTDVDEYSVVYRYAPRFVETFA